MKKRIFVHMHYMELGGAEKALIGLLEAIDKTRYDVDLFLNQHTGPFMSQIPEGINILSEIPAYSALERPVSWALKRGMLGDVINRMLRKRDMKRYLKKHPGEDAVSSHVYMDRAINRLPSLHHLGEYDLAISFLDPPHIVQDKVRAKTKVEWIHTDFFTIPYNAELTGPRWGANNYIISISDSVTESFTKRFPGLAPKIRLIENIISPAFVRAQANEPLPSTFRQTPDSQNTAQPKSRQTNLQPASKPLKLCSMGRVTAQAKNFVVIPAIIRALADMGTDVKWVIVGPGDTGAIEVEAKKHGMEGKIIFAGPQSNPYPFIKDCDIYVQPSTYEGKSIAVREAQILCKPVVITNYSTAPSQVQSGVDGIICGMEPQEIAEAIHDLQNTTDLRNKITSHLATHDYGLCSEVEKLYQLIQ